MRKSGRARAHHGSAHRSRYRRPFVGRQDRRFARRRLRVAGSGNPKRGRRDSAKTACRPKSLLRTASHASTWNCYDKYLRGNALLFQFSPATLAEAKEAYAQALSLDPDFAAGACLARDLAMWSNGFSSVRISAKASCQRRCELSARAAELAPDDGLVLARCAIVVTLLSDDLEKAMSHCRAGGQSQSEYRHGMGSSWLDLEPVG